VAVPSKAWVCGRSLAGSAGSNRTGGMEHCVLSGTDLCDWPIPRLEKSYRVCVCVCVCVVTECDKGQQ